MIGTKSSSQPGSPSDMLRILTPWLTAQSIPPSTRATTSPPSITIALASIAPGATPTRFLPTGRPAMVAAVWVPWPRDGTPATRSLSKAFARRTWRPRSSNSANDAMALRSVGCSSSAPVSRCPTVTPAPLSPSFQSAGTFMALIPQPIPLAGFEVAVATGRIRLHGGAPSTAPTWASPRSASRPFCSTVPNMTPRFG